jgi:hypothetical protein
MAAKQHPTDIQPQPTSVQQSTVRWIAIGNVGYLLEAIGKKRVTRVMGAAQGRAVEAAERAAAERVVAVRAVAVAARGEPGEGAVGVRVG